MDSHQPAVVNRLKTARGHISGIISIVGDDAYCPDVMKQLSAVQGLLEGASRVMLRRHLETCVAKAMREGRTAEIVDELMETLKFDKQVFRTPTEAVAGAVLAAQDASVEPAIAEPETAR
jgi:DNA-binding FrmR family transcriptional regulator